VSELLLEVRPTHHDGSSSSAAANQQSHRSLWTTIASCPRSPTVLMDNALHLQHVLHSSSSCALRIHMLTLTAAVLAPHMQTS
jgi:hypothetical protein